MVPGFDGAVSSAFLCTRNTVQPLFRMRMKGVAVAIMQIARVLTSFPASESERSESASCE